MYSYVVNLISKRETVFTLNMFGEQYSVVQQQ